MDPLSPEAAQGALSRSLMLFAAFEALADKTFRLGDEYKKAVLAFDVVSSRLAKAMDEAEASEDDPITILEEYIAADTRCQEVYAAYLAANEEMDKMTFERIVEPFVEWASAFAAVSDIGWSPEEKKLKHLVQEFVSSFKSGDIEAALSVQAGMQQIASQMGFAVE